MGALFINFFKSQSNVLPLAIDRLISPSVTVPISFLFLSITRIIWHLDLFKTAKKQCDKLVVLINSDKSIKDLKGDRRPIIKLKKRIELLKLIKSIDDIISFNEKTPMKMIKKILPDILFKGSDYKQKQVVGYDIIKKNGGTVKIINKLSNFSTTKLIKE